MGSGRKENEADDEFRRAVADAKPLAHRRKHLHTKRPAPVAKQRLKDERAALAESLGPLSAEDALDTGEALAYLSEGLARDVLRKLRRGHWVVEDELDLHGMNRHTAAMSLTDFLRDCRHRRLGCVRIVHGKGLGSRQREPVLKGLLRKWLVRQDVLAFSQAPAAKGGSGAVLVLLKT
jgi:DNA-nicking Smr family endonuclease